MRGKAPKLQSYHAGGYTAAKQKRLDAVVLPDKTRCFICEKMKNTTAMFSEKQQNDLRNGMASGQVPLAHTTKAWITCRDCTGTQNYEMQCCVCDEVKGLDGFAKAQRKDPDNARCMVCIAEVANTGPNQHSDNDSDSDESQSNVYGSTVDDTDDLDSDSGVPLPDDLTAENLDVLNVSRVNSTKPSASKASTTASLAGTGRLPGRPSATGVGAWTTMSKKNSKGNVDARKPHYTAYDPQGTAHRKAVSTSSSVADYDSDTTTTYAGDVTHKLDATHKPEAKFAKVPAGPREVPVPTYSGGRNVSYDNDSDDDDDDDFFTM